MYASCFQNRTDGSKHHAEKLERTATNQSSRIESPSSPIKFRGVRSFLRSLFHGVEKGGKGLLERSTRWIHVSVTFGRNWSVRLSKKHPGAISQISVFETSNRPSPYQLVQVAAKPGNQRARRDPRCARFSSDQRAVPNERNHCSARKCTTASGTSVSDSPCSTSGPP